jgi:capsule polysaccharide modification protein KpsS
MIKNLKITILLIFIMIIGSTAEAKFMNKFKKGFYFEKYKTAEEAKSVLLEMHPVGSDVDALVKTLEEAGATVTEIKKESIDKYISQVEKEQECFKGVLYYEYYRNEFLAPYGWTGIIIYSKQNTYLSIFVWKEYLGL